MNPIQYGSIIKQNSPAAVTPGELAQFASIGAQMGQNAYKYFDAAKQQKAAEDAAAQQKARLGEFQKRHGELTPNSSFEQREALYRDFPEYTENIDRIVGRFKDAEANDAANAALQARIAYQNDDEEGAAKILEAQGELYKESNPTLAESYKGMGQMFRENPEGAFALMDDLMARIPGTGEKYIGALQKIATKDETVSKGYKAGEEGRKAGQEADEVQADATQARLESKAKISDKKTELELRRDELNVRITEAGNTTERNRLQAIKDKHDFEIAKLNAGIDAEKLKQLPTQSQTKLSELDTQQGETRKMLREIDDLMATKGVDFSGGWTESLWTTLKTISGNRDEREIWKTRAQGLVTRGVIAAMPKGPASDTDVALVQKGFPPEGSSKQEYEKYFGAFKRLADKANEYTNAKINWIASNKNGISYPKWDRERDVPVTIDGEILEINGRRPKKGQNFDQFWEEGEKATADTPVKSDFQNMLDMGVTPSGGNITRGQSWQQRNKLSMEVVR